MTEKSKVITVFGSSRPEDGHADYAEALELGRVLAVTSSFFRSCANRWVEEETRVATWQERLFELVRLGDGFVACKGGTGTLVELAVVWEMLNKKAMEQRPF